MQGEAELEFNNDVLIQMLSTQAEGKKCQNGLEGKAVGSPEGELHYSAVGKCFVVYVINTLLFYGSQLHHFGGS